MTTTTGRYTTPRGHRATMTIRPDTNDDNVCRSVINEDEYRIGGLDLDGTALDIGAHIGAATVLLGLDFPHLRVIAVEPVPDNCRLLLANVEQNGLNDRVTVIEGAAGTKGTIRYDHSGNDDALTHRWIGNQRMARGVKSIRSRVPTYSLARLVKLAGGEVAFCKIDAEGAEYSLLRGPSLRAVKRIHGEYHAGPLDFADDEWLTIRYGVGDTGLFFAEALRP